jgi:hypothetical protein
VCGRILMRGGQQRPFRNFPCGVSRVRDSFRPLGLSFVGSFGCFFAGWS